MEGFFWLASLAVRSPVAPVTSSWYAPRELPTRLGIWYSATGIFTIFSGIMNYAIGNIHGTLASWKYMYLVAGSITMGWAIIVLALLPDTPASAPRWLFTPHERATLASLETARARTAGPIIWPQVWEALRDPQIWALSMMGAAVYVCNGGVTAFGSLIIKSFGYTSSRAILLQAPGGATTCVAIYLATWLAVRIMSCIS
jgi:sugar phosphate permease